MSDIEPIITDEVLRQRIRQLVEPPSSRPTSTSDRLLRHPITSLIIGFVLTGVLGTFISGTIQDRSERARRDAEIRESRRQSALTTLDTLGAVLNTTYFLFGEYWDAIRRDLPDRETDGRFQLFDSARAEFEQRRLVDAARVEVHFGPSLRAEYEAIADSVQFLVGNFDIARLDRTAIAEFSPSVENLKANVSDFLIRMVRAADSIATAR